MMSNWSSFLLERAARVPPAGCRVIPGSTPVVSFGDPRARVATLSINPSSKEFVQGGRMLEGAERRLATLASLGVAKHEEIDVRHAATIVSECSSYFERKPYWEWFGVLDEILRDAAGASYRAGAGDLACHLDLVQWATDRAWSEVDAGVRARLIAEDRPFLHRQLREGRYRLLLVNGKQQTEALATHGLVDWTPVERNDDGLGCTFHRGRFRDASLSGTVVLSWSWHLQQARVSSNRKRAVIAWLKTLVRRFA